MPATTSGFRSSGHVIRDGGFRTAVVPLQEEVVRDVRATLYLPVGRRALRAPGRRRQPRESVSHAIVRPLARAGDPSCHRRQLARIGRQVLTETTLLAVCGGVMGVAAGWWVLLC